MIISNKKLRVGLVKTLFIIFIFNFNQFFNYLLQADTDAAELYAHRKDQLVCLSWKEMQNFEIYFY